MRTYVIVNTSDLLLLDYSQLLTTSIKLQYEISMEIKQL